MCLSVVRQCTRNRIDTGLLRVLKLKKAHVYDKYQSGVLLEPKENNSDGSLCLRAVFARLLKEKIWFFQAGVFFFVCVFPSYDEASLLTASHFLRDILFRKGIHRASVMREWEHTSFGAHAHPFSRSR